MIWVSWRQHRGQAVICLAVLGVIAIFAIAVGVWMRTAFTGDGLPSCLAHSGGSGCQAAITSFTNRFNSGFNVNATAGVLLLAIPGLLGSVVGASLLGRELERGTWRLAWSQTVPRNRWLLTQLAVVVGGLVVFGAVATGLITWYRSPLDQLTSTLQAPPFALEGLVPTASLLCAFGLGVLAGLLLRNSIGAMVAAFVVWEALTLASTILSTSASIPGPATERIPCRNGCPASGVVPITGHLGDVVLSKARSGHDLVVTYLPASRFWTLQGIESGAYLVIAAAALLTAVWLLNRRTT